MTFSRKLWSEITPVTAAELNRMEQGIYDASLVEEGQNENGIYYRFANGIQICLQEVSSETFGAVDTSSGALYRSQANRWTFPAAFINSIDVSVNANVSTYLRWVSSYVLNRTYATIVQFSTIEHTNSFSAELFAIGRWK